MRLNLVLSFTIIVMGIFGESQAKAQDSNSDLCTVWMEGNRLQTSADTNFWPELEVTDYDFSPSGNLIYSSDWWTEIYSYDLEWGTQTTLISENSSDLMEFTDLSASTDGRLAFSARHQWGGPYMLYVLSGLGVERYEVAGFSPDWSSDNQSIAYYSSDDGSLANARVQTINLITSEVTDIGLGIYPAWSPDGTKIAYQTGIYGQLMVYEIETGEHIALPMMNVLGVEWVNDHTLLYSDRKNPEGPNSIWTYDLESGLEIQVLSNPNSNMIYPSLCPENM
jgi:hypothetical protein